MKARVLASSYVYDFVGQSDLDSTLLCAEGKAYADRFTELVDDKKLDDWEVCFRFRYNNVKSILIHLTGRSDRRERYKELVIHLPIPVNKEIGWGVDVGQHMYKDANHLDHLMKNFSTLGVDYSRFDNKQAYIADCMKRSISFCFSKGFTINGVKVQILLNDERG